uniref:cell wall hydrolase n=1 Tax=Altererythrobacter segetis TaxID=1104773 RepID=UPI001A9C688E|nr:cell wall hydrolase [Altererythrobacter segetis]
MLTREQALAINDVRPVVLGGLQTALAFNYSDKLISPTGHQSAVDCLATAVYYEAGGEPEEGQRAVAQVVLNRVRHPAYPQTVCGVVYQGSELPSGCQFTFTCDGSLARQPSGSAWQRARRIAEEALAGRVEPSVGMATHYHANWVVPYWAASLDKIAAVGSHIFYRWRGYWGQRQAFDKPYAGEAAGATRLAYADKLLAAWDENTPQGIALSSTHPAQSRDDLVDRLQPRPAADLAVRELLADDASGRLVVDDPATSAPRAMSLTLAP